jgi:tRNA 2-selenouridine synthase
MNPRPLDADDALARLSTFGAVLDARSPGEYALDHLPHARSWAVLDDAERARVGLLYVQTGPFEARRVGAALVARNIAAHIERDASDWPRDLEPLVYCWRGGQRSGALAHVLAQVGWRVHLVRGGYKALRAALVRQLAALASQQRFVVLCGPTGSGKSRLLQALARAGAQVLDLEQLAAHRGSVLGALPGVEQPTQKAFETSIWDALRGFDAQGVVWVESESRKIGRLQVPDALLERMRAAPCLRLHTADAARVRILREDYAELAADVPALQQRLRALRELRGHAVVEHWCAMVERGELDQLVVDLLAQHYDPGYRGSSERNYSGFAAAPTLSVDDAGSFDTLAAQLAADAG